jgi:O-antigen/teichoic acid export membrane protein
VTDRIDPAVVDPARAAETTTGVSVARSSTWNLAATVLPQTYLVAISVAAARFLGPEQFGRQSFIAFVELSLVTLLVSGLALAVSRYVGAALGAKEPGHVHVLVRVSARIAWAAAALVAGIIVVVALVGAGPQAAWIFAAMFAATSALQRVRNAVLTGFQRWREVTLGGLGIGAVATVVVIGVLALGGGISGIFAVEAAAGAVLLVWTAVLAQRALRSLGAGRADGAPTRRMLRYTGLASISVVLTLVVWRRSEFLFLNHYSTNTEIGFYSIAFAAAAAVLLLPLAVIGVLLPSIATLHGADELARIRSGYTRAARLLLVCSLPLIAAGMALGPLLIELVYGSTYGQAGTLLVILLVPAPLVVVGNLASVVLAATERLLFPGIVGAIAAALNIALSFALIPRHDSVGAAIANAIAQLVSAAPGIVYVHRRVGGVDWMPASIGKAALSSAAGGLVAFGFAVTVGSVAGFVLGLVAGSAVFLVLARMLRMLSADDAQWLDHTVGGALRGNLGRAVRFYGAAPSKGQ